METIHQGIALVQEHKKQSGFVRSTSFGLAGGIAGSLVMQLFLLGASAAGRLPALAFLAFIGDTIAQLLTRFGIYLPGGVPMCLAMQDLIGAIFGMIYVFMLSNVNALHARTLRKGILQAVIFAEIISQPLLATTTILLKMPVTTALLWYGASLVMHFLYGVTLGAIVWLGLDHKPRESTNLN